jgi:hypothetical protein
MSKLFRAALLFAICALSLGSVSLLAPRTYGGAVKASASSKSRKKSKSKPRKTEKILKGHHTKRKGKPA